MRPMTTRIGAPAMVAVAALTVFPATGRTAETTQRMTGPTFDVRRHTLDNGLELLILVDRTAPTFCYMTHFRVGSRNEGPGITGISHLFEHMMFNGSERYGPKEFDRIVESSGGYSNGSTWYDYTNYYEEVSSDSLETILDLESDRMRALLITPENLEQERSIVKEERRLRTDNVPEGKMFEVLLSNAWTASPYRWPIVGWEPDLDAIRLEDCLGYFRTYYAPNNAIVTVVGDVDASRVIALMKDRFGSIPKQDPPRPVHDPEPAQKGEKRVLHRMKAELPAVMIGYKAVAWDGEDYPALEVIRSILTDGESSRLYRGLIYEKQIATEAWAFFRPTLMDSLFILYAQGKETTDSTALEGAIYEELIRIGSGGVTDREMTKARNQIRAEALREMKTNAGRAERIGFYHLLSGDYRTMDTILDRVTAVTPDQVAKAARRYFKPDGRTVVVLQPEDRP